MKPLQNNFTTPEQSKRLLELGLPADSADCYLQRRFGTDQWSEEKQFIPHDKLYSQWCTSRIQLPCWSVGRLIEIFLTCFVENEFDDGYYAIGKEDIDYNYSSIVEHIIALIQDNIRDLDFSKLED